MALRVFKYTFDPLKLKVCLSVPLGSKILTGGIDPRNKKNCAVWLLVNDKEEEKEDLLVQLAATGFDNVLEWWEYLESFKSPDGNYIFHIFYTWHRDDSN